MVNVDAVVVDGIRVPFVPPHLAGFVGRAVRDARLAIDRRDGQAPRDLLELEAHLFAAAAEVAKARARSRAFDRESEHDTSGGPAGSSRHELTSKQAAQRVAELRAKPSFTEQAITRAAREHQLPARRVGRAWLFDRADVDAFAEGA